MIRFVFSILVFCSSTVWSAKVSFTMDDPTTVSTPVLSSVERNQKILLAFERNKIKGALFVCGMRIDNAEGRNLLNLWDSKGHLIANHSYSHLYYHGNKTSFDMYRDDFLKVEPLISNLRHFVKIFRFPSKRLDGDV